jgi:hypothetical protein
MGIYQASAVTETTGMSDDGIVSDQVTSQLLPG